jgi:glycosyltransferase involved in cell wall biosynthesis
LKRIVVSVTNDLETDQRVHRICSTLSENNYEIILIGRRFKNSKKLLRNYKTFRFKLVFNKGPLFYAEYNIRLFFKLLFLKPSILLANDLDTLLANFLASKVLITKLVYDSHELFTEVPELTHRPFIQNIWLTIEKFIVPKIKTMYTVNEEIASIYIKKYGLHVSVIRNIAHTLKNSSPSESFVKKIKGNKKMLIFQGSGINMDRGAEEALEMMQYLENTLLYIIGSGDVFEILKEKRISLNLEDKVIILDKMPYEKLMEYTKAADLGLSLDKNTNLNYEYSLPNKIFDYIQCNTPILASNRKLVAQLISKNNIGKIITTHNPQKLAEIVNEIFNNEKEYTVWKKNLKTVAKIYNWENESKKLIEIFNKIN